MFPSFRHDRYGRFGGCSLPHPEVSREATKEEIKSAFRKKARTLHPDVNKAPDAEEKFKELGKAYETLMDDNKRATYDRYGEDGLKNAGFNTSGPFDGGFGDLNDIFSSFFGGMGGFGFGGRPDPNAPVEGDDLRLDIEIDFEQAIFGCEKEIKFDHLELCSECGGTGAEKGRQFRKQRSNFIITFVYFWKPACFNTADLTHFF